MRQVPMLVVLATGVFAGAAHGQQVPPAVARLIDRQGREVGIVQLHETATKGVMLRIEVSGLAPGAHGLHIHSVGRCDAPSFETAGSHFNAADRSHGSRSPGGPHPGDLTNLDVPGPGRIEAERMARSVTLADGAANSLFDTDGSAILIHADVDDNVSQPGGNAGAPVVCGVIQR